MRRSAKICRLSEKQIVCKPDGACVFVNAIGIQMQIGSCVNQRAAVGEARLRLNRERKEKVAGTLAGRNKHIQIFIVKCNHPRIACAELQTNIQGGIIYARAVFQCRVPARNGGRCPALCGDRSRKKASAAQPFQKQRGGKESKMIQVTLKIDGMMCGMCESHINDCIRSYFQIKKVTSSHTKGETAPGLDKLKAAIAETGYTVTDAKVETIEKKSGLFGLFGKK